MNIVDGVNLAAVVVWINLAAVVVWIAWVVVRAFRGTSLNPSQHSVVYLAHIPTVMEDWDAEFRERTGKNVVYCLQIYGKANLEERIRQLAAEEMRRQA